MRKVNIPNVGVVEYMTKDDIINDTTDPNREALLEIFSVMENISRFLDVPCPYLAIAETIRQFNIHTGQISDMCAMLYTPDDAPGLTNNLIQISAEHTGRLELSGTIAHEMRHIWQYKNIPDLNKERAQGYTDSLFNPAEIDADGFAIAILVINNIPLEEAGQVVCPMEKKNDIKAYNLRIEKANEIMAEISSANKNKENDKNGFFARVWNRISAWLGAGK